MFKKSIRINIWVIMASLFVDLGLLITTIISKHKNETVFLAGITVIIGFISILVMAYSIFDIIRIKKWNEELDMLPYDFNYNLEYEIYRLIARKEKGKKAREIKKRNIVIPKKYSEWKRHIDDNFGILKETDDFYRFLRHVRRRQEVYYDGITMVAVPLEVVILTATLTLLKSPETILITLAIMVIYVVILVIKEMLSAKTQMHFIDDFIEIIFPEADATKESTRTKAKKN